MSQQINLSALLNQAVPGDLIGVAGRGIVGHTIRVAAKISNPKIKYRDTWSHVGMVFYTHPSTDALTLLESTSKNTVPDLATSEIRRGVSVVDLEARLKTAGGRLWWRPMTKRSRETLDKERLVHCYHQNMGKLYENFRDLRGLWNLADASLFDRVYIGDEQKEKERLLCSELVATMAITGIGWIGRMPSQVEPTDLAVGYDEFWNDKVEVVV